LKEVIQDFKSDYDTYFDDKMIKEETLRIKEECEQIKKECLKFAP
jgi:uncharacterized protein YeeX (DUF496 family)